MNRLLISAALAFGLVAPAQAEMLMVANIQLSGGSAVFELYDEPAALPECRGGNAGGVIAKMRTKSKTVGYGTGCWVADDKGFIHLLVKSFDDGRTRETSLHKSRFTAPQPAKPAGEAKRLIDQADALDDACRGGSGDNPKTQAACSKRDAVMAKIDSMGWCWGPDDAIGANKGWMRCQ